jgi:hypothetical protein
MFCEGRPGWLVQFSACRVGWSIRGGVLARATQVSHQAQSSGAAERVDEKILQFTQQVVDKREPFGKYYDLTLGINRVVPGDNLPSEP